MGGASIAQPTCMATSRVPFRIGNGYDIHRLVPSRPLIIGGVEISHYKGLLGHSDADVLIHAIIDAVLGALALGDIGQLFPPEDPRWKDANSLKLLAVVKQVISARSWTVNNVDSVVIAEKPKFRPHIEAMRENIAHVLGVSKEQVSIKATTNEQLGAIGQEEAIAAQAVVLLVMED